MCHRNVTLRVAHALFRNSESYVTAASFPFNLITSHMRIIGGQFKGRKFFPPAKNWPTRPTTDFAKEGLFNVLNNSFYFDEIKVLDLFGGTGSHSYEFISRGCEDVTYVDQFRGCINFVTKTAETLKIEDKIKIVQADVFKFIQRDKNQYDYIFAGPPYPLPTLPLIPDKVFDNDLVKEMGWLVVEHNRAHDFSSHPRFDNTRSYGKAIFSIFK
ncbi:MAG: RsmD family RNA methyltransferase [Bacteroidota bacterium]